MSKHTPVPWEVEDDVIVDPITKKVIVNCCETDYSSVINEANARFIVRACNSYEELLAALKQIANRPFALNDAESSIIRRIAKNAIAKVEGENP